MAKAEEWEEGLTKRRRALSKTPLEAASDAGLHGVLRFAQDDRPVKLRDWFIVP